ncbi:MAG: AI-2E family transporter [Treponema sp.]|jgi:predicted PurR-regulated permease PerM|nr:AI-2E family transporter [Treponema sp.]
MTEDNKKNRNGKKHFAVQNIVFGALLVILFILVCRLFAPFFTTLLWSILFYVLFSPLHEKIVSRLDRTRLKGKILRNIWAAAFSLGTVIIILLPLAFVGFQFFRQVIDLIHFVRNYLNSYSGQEIITTLFDDISQKIGELSSGQIVFSADEIRSRILVFLSSGLQNLLQLSRNVAMNVGSFFIGLAFMVFSLFFFYLDGAYLSNLVLHTVPIRKDYMKALVGKFKEITKNLVLGYIMVALVQAVMAFIIFSVFKVTGALVFAALTFFCAFIPILGAGVVWFPLGLLRILYGDIIGGILFLLSSGIFISTLDNLLRPFFLRDRIQLHPLIIFFAILGGVSVFGFNGIILGPMLVILFLTVLDLFLMEHKIGQDDNRTGNNAV